MQEVQRGLLHQQVVMIGRAPHERGQPRHPVADLESQALGEEPLRRLLIQGADHHVAEALRLCDRAALLLAGEIAWGRL